MQDNLGIFLTKLLFYHDFPIAMSFFRGVSNLQLLASHLAGPSDTTFQVRALIQSQHRPNGFSAMAVEGCFG